MIDLYGNGVQVQMWSVCRWPSFQRYIWLFSRSLLICIFFCGGKQFMFCIWNICIYSSVIISVHKLNEAGTFFFKSDIWKDGNNVISLRLSSTHVFETAHIYAPACRDAREGNNHRFLTAWQHGYGCEGISSATMWSGLKAVSYLLNRTVCCQSNTVSTQLHIQPFLSFLFFFK